MFVRESGLNREPVKTQERIGGFSRVCALFLQHHVGYTVDSGLGPVEGKGIAAVCFKSALLSDLGLFLCSDWFQSDIIFTAFYPALCLYNQPTLSEGNNVVQGHHGGRENTLGRDTLVTAIHLLLNRAT